MEYNPACPRLPSEHHRGRMYMEDLDRREQSQHCGLPPAHSFTENTPRKGRSEVLKIATRMGTPQQFEIEDLV